MTEYTPADLYVYQDLASPFIQSKSLAHIDRIREINRGEMPVPVTVEIDLADGFCNHACPHCFFGTQLKKQPVYLETARLKQVIDDFATHGVRAIELVGGGEPTTHPDIAAIISHAGSRGIDTGLVTNGQLLPKIYESAHHLKYIRISLDAASPEIYQLTHGSRHFTKVIHNIRGLAEHMDMSKVGCAYLITPDNVEDILPAAELVNSLGCRFIQYRPATLDHEVDPTIWEAARELAGQAATLHGGRGFQVFDAGIKWYHLERKRNFARCTTSPLVAVLKASGDIALCILKRNEEESHLGNIYQADFFDIWFSSRHQELIDAVDLGTCPKPCKHDSYNIVAESVKHGAFHENFI